MDYDIVTYCSESYSKAFRFSIRSWVDNSRAKRFYIYTDSKNIYRKNSRITFTKLFEKNNNWLENIGRKNQAIEHYLNNTSQTNFAFIEIDCYILDDLSHIFKKDFDIAVTRLFSKEKHTCCWFF